MKKILSLVLALTMLALCVVSFGSCKKNTSDWEAIEEKGKFVCGITIYAPMNYYDANSDLVADESGDLVGFDTELAKLVAEKLGVEVEFQVIEWENKYIELQSGSIDCIWNGFTSNSLEKDGTPRSELVDFTHGYLDNTQCVVVLKDNLADYTSKESLKGKKAAAESESAGESFAESAEASAVVGVSSQMDAFIELKSGSVDFVVVDKLLAKSYVGEGDYANLAMAPIELDSEVYAIGCRKGSDFDEKINEALIELLNEGKIEELAEKYSVRITESLLAMKDED